MASATQRLLAVAQGEVGYYEKASNAQLDSKTANRGSNNWTKYARDLDILNTYNGAKNGYYWCDVFVDWLFVKTFGFTAGLKMIGQTQGDCGAGCTFSAKYYKAMGRLLYANPQPGDQIFFGDRLSGNYYHTGVVYKVDNNYVYTIEGNTTANDGVNGNGDGVAQKRYSLSYEEIGAYGRPLWELAPVEESKTTETEEENMARYNSIEEIPKYAKSTITKLCKKGYLNGSGKKKDKDGLPADLDLTIDMIRLLVINDRAGMYGE